MAKRFNPFNVSQIPPEFALAVRTYNLNGQNIAKFAETMPTPSAETIAEMRLLYTNANAAWTRLATWKRSRWALCAIATWGNSLTNSGAKGFSAYTLYIKCWVEQRPEPTKQPISPCSARVTDPAASPWNFQP